MASYTETSQKKGQVTPSADNNWKFAPAKTDVKLNVVFETANSEKAAAFVPSKGQYPMQKVGTDDAGFALYKIQLSR